jgi:type VI secretion system secreted protein VgrG
MKDNLKRTIEIITPLEKDVLLLHRMRGKEELGRLFAYELDLLSTDPTVPLDEVLGQPLTITLRRPEDEVRYFNGYCTRISQGGKRGRYYAYSATVSPWLWFLTRTTNCRIFQEKTVPDIIKEIFAQHSAIVDVKVELTETYTPWEYSVQYRESDFDFISRLMEMEGIYYFFTHVEGRHTMVLADSYDAHALAREEEILYIPPGKVVRPDLEHIAEWTISHEVRPGKYALTDFDFERPSVDLQVKSNIRREHALAEYEIYDYPGDYIQRSDGEQYARLRIEEQQAKYERVSGKTNWRSCATGALFKLSEHPRADQNEEYLIVSTDIELQSSEYESLDEPGTPAVPYSCTLTALNTQQPFRPERITKKPMVRGPQTAIVVGPSGETIHTDKYGRVKVHFHWDRYGRYDDTASCWTRVSQNWGGKNWGGMFIPHVGQEVIVMFEEGDPDRPIVTGRVYNAEQMPPVELPSGKTKSIIRDHGGNEIVSEGQGGVQQMRIHSPYANTTLTMGAPSSDDGFRAVTDAFMVLFAGRDWKVDVVGSHKENIGGFQKQSITLARHTFIGAIDNETVVGGKLNQVGGYRSEMVGAYKTEYVRGRKNVILCSNFTELIRGNHTVTLNGNRTDLVKSNETATVNGNRIHLVKGNSTATVNGNRDDVVKGNLQTAVDGNRVEAIKGKHETTVDGDAGNTFKAKLTEAITGDYTTTCDANIGIEAKGGTLTLKCGGASITLHNGGKIEIKGTDLEVDASASAKIGASGALEMSGATFELGATGGGKVKAGSTLDLSGPAMVTIN